MSERNDPLERLLDRALQELPLRRAPPALESRVLRELESRSSLPWWRRSFAHWPLLARAAFLVVCGVLIRFALLGGATAAAGVGSLGWARHAGMLMSAGANLAAWVASTAPPAWLYASVAVFAGLYVALFGLGAVLYRTLYLQPTRVISRP